MRTSFLSRFVGRERELAEIRTLVQSNRLVTLLGTGGLGKTRLGYRVADDLAESCAGRVWAVELADLVEPRLLVHTISAALEIPPPADELDVSLIVEHLSAGQALLYLDNCEHLIESCAQVAAALLARCPDLHILTSTRQALGVMGEHVYQVPTLSQDDSVSLFADRAAATQPSWQLTSRDEGDVLELCSALEGMPLAIELAAVQIRAFTPQAMTGRLRDSGTLLAGSLRGEPARKASLEACIQWSHDLCTADERRLWARLAVFSGGFTLDAAEAVCSDDELSGDAVVVALRGLVEKSLVERDADDVEGRYRLLEVIRQFGSAQLATDELLGWRRRHRDYYLAMVERFDAEWTGPDQRTWIQRFRQEHANLRLAFDLSAGDPMEAPLAMRMSAVLEHYFAATGGGPEALHWLQLTLAHGTGTPLERAGALRVGVFIGSLVAALDSAAEMYDELVALVDENPDDEVIRGHQLYAGSVLRTWQGDPATGAQLAAEGIDVLHRLGDVPHEANLHFLHGMMLGWADRPAEAATAYQHCFELTEPRRERWLASYSLWGLGVDAFMAGRLEEAIKLEREALEVKADFGDQLGIGLTLGALGWVAAEQGRGKDAALLLGATEAIWGRIGMTVAAMPYLSRRREEGIERTRTLLGEADFEALSASGREMPQEDVVQLALGRTQSEAPSPLDSLTRRERQIADHLAVGMSNKEIAERLFISVRTVETHVENILRKLELQSRAQVPSAMRTV